MRVLHVVASDQRRGAEVFASDLVDALTEAGVVQQVAVLRASEDGIVFGAPVRVVGGGPRVPGLRVDARALVGLRQLAMRFDPHVIQAHGGEPLKHVVTSGIGRGRRVVYRRIGDASWVRGRLATVAHGAVMRRADATIAVSDSVREEALHRFTLAPDRVTTIVNGFRPERLEPRSAVDLRANLGIHREAVVLLTLGALSWEKDPLTHLEVSARLLDRGLDVHHLFVGDGPLRERLATAIVERGLEGRVDVLGQRRDVGDVLAAADLMLLASRTEGMPACVLEASWAGVPTVAYALPGVAEVVLDGESGALVPPGDVDALVDATEELARDPLRRKRMGQRGRALASMFDIRAVSERYLQVYERLGVSA